MFHLMLTTRRALALLAAKKHHLEANSGNVFFFVWRLVFATVRGKQGAGKLMMLLYQEDHGFPFFLIF